MIANFCAATVPAWADERMTPLAVSGSWVAMAHQSGMTAAPDVCIAANPIQHVGLRADSDGVELRISDEKWSLPTDVQGSIVINIGSWNAKVDISANTGQTVAALIPNDVLHAMFSAMDKAAVMSVVVGNSEPRAVSLAGSSKATKCPSGNILCGMCRL